MKQYEAYWKISGNLDI